MSRIITYSDYTVRSPSELKTNYLNYLMCSSATYSAFCIPTHTLYDERSDSDTAIGMIFGFYREVRTPVALFVPNKRETRAFRAISDYGVRYLLK
jgi:hypothetical protein